MSWFSSTHVTIGSAASDSSIDARIASASHGAKTSEKLNAMCSSSGRRYRATRRWSEKTTSPTKTRSPS
jgi:hypothetical protein